jgi:transcriptional regulator NrdR family protein
MKCDICRKKINETFLKKILGTHIKDGKGKKHSICFECQKRFKTKEEILKQL